MPLRSNRRDFLALACAGLSTAAGEGCLSAAPAPRATAVSRLGNQPERPDGLEFGAAVCGCLSHFTALDQPAVTRPLGKRSRLALDEAGWVMRLEPGCAADALMCTSLGGHYPRWTVYVFCTKAKGSSRFPPTWLFSSRFPGRMRDRGRLRSDGGFWLRLTATKSSDYVRNIRVIMPGFEPSFQSDPFHPTFLQRWQGIACLRFMNWMQANHVELEDWKDRPQVTDATFFSQGVALETMIDLSNRLQADPWFCMPHRSNDDYVRQFASMVQDRLDPALRVYMEYSNEVWNPIFCRQSIRRTGGHRSGALPINLGPPQFRYTAYRSTQIFRIWQEVFGGTQRLVRIVPSQAGNPVVSRQILEFQQTHQQADALAIAPYSELFGVPRRRKTLTLDEVSQWSVDQALDYMQQRALPRVHRAGCDDRNRWPTNTDCYWWPTRQGNTWWESRERRMTRS